jgi:uncharacterized protein
MTTPVSPQNNLPSAIAQFARQNFLNLETFRKNGQGVPTPVWFVENNGALYVHTQADSGKVKRIRNNGRVRVVPADMRGDPRGVWVEGQAALLDPAENERYDRLFKKKYGLQWTMFGAAGKARKAVHVTIEIKI